MQNALFQRFVRDAALSVAILLPAAAAAAASLGLDLGSEPHRMVDNFDVIVELPASPALVDAKSVTLTVKDSADGVTYAAIPSLAAITVTGAGGLGGGAVATRLKLPDTCRQYLRLDAAVESGGGDNTALTATLSLLF